MAFENEEQNQQAKNKIESPKSVPTEIITDILLKLPVESLLRCKSVCKAWYSLISDPYFVKSHLNLSSSRNDYAHHRLVLVTFSQKKLMSCSFSEVLNDEYVNNAFELDYPLKQYGCCVDIIGSCNGLLCINIRSYMKQDLFIWNPSTRRSKKVTSPYSCDSSITVSTEYFRSYGFGYEVSTDDYKLVRVSYEEFEGTLYDKKVHIYSLKTGNWKKIDDLAHGFPTEVYGTFTNGAIHWIGCCENSCQNMILCVDLAKETFSEVLLPVYDKDDLFNDMLGTLGEMLCVICSYPNGNGNTDVWAMKVYGVNDSWTKLVSIPSYVTGYGKYDYLAPLCSLNDGKVVLKFGQTSVLYDTKNTSYSNNSKL